MKKEIKDKWIKALESRRYLQARGKLKRRVGNKYGYCCLGVLTQLYCNEHKISFSDVKTSGSAEVLPRVVMDWAGLMDSDPLLTLSREDKRKILRNIKKEDNNFSRNIGSIEDEQEASHLNDDGDLNFVEIARAIKRTF